MTGQSVSTAFDSPSKECLSARQTIHAIAEPMVIAIFFCTLLCSSALLFLLEPMFAKLLLPLLGGTPEVWNTCMVCFQAMLLGAYAFGHWSIRWLGVRRQAGLQLMLLLVGAMALPVSLPGAWQQPAGRNPILWVIEVVAIGVGFPFFAVATTAPVLQRWFASTGHRSAADPYFLYVASNLGSLVALMAYPTLVEPLMHLKHQTHVWSFAYAGLFVLCGCCALFVKSGHNNAQTHAQPITRFRRLRWIVLAMIPSSLLLGTTTFMTTDIAAVPMLWIVPLILYLLSFVLVFARCPILPHRMMLRLLPVCVLGVALFMLAGVAQPVWMVLILHLACLFICSMACHGELAANRPSVGRLTDFFLMMALGGLIGGIFNALAAPLLFNSAVEYPIALIAACAICPQWRPSKWKAGRSGAILDIIWAAAVGALAWGIPRAITVIMGESISWRIFALGIAVMAIARAVTHRRRFVASLVVLFVIAGAGVHGGQVLLVRRSFYGIHRVVRNPIGPFNDIYHGTTVHGRQLVDPNTGAPSHATTPLTYYTRSGPIGQLMTQMLTANAAKRISVVGLGVGSLAAYAKQGTQLTFFEIDPAVSWLAHDSGYFSFLTAARDRGAIVRIVMGDARLTLRQTPSRSCDLLVIDAFCGDAVPVHLLTRQAMHIYLDTLNDQGILAFHTSNLYLNLLPVCSALAADAGCTGMYRSDLVVSAADSAAGKCASQWVVVARNRSAINLLSGDSRWQPLPPRQQRVWTDDFSNILSILCWK